MFQIGIYHIAQDMMKLVGEVLYYKINFFINHAARGL